MLTAMTGRVIAAVSFGSAIRSKKLADPSAAVIGSADAWRSFYSALWGRCPAMVLLLLLLLAALVVAGVVLAVVVIKWLFILALVAALCLLILFFVRRVA